MRPPVPPRRAGFKVLAVAGLVVAGAAFAGACSSDDSSKTEATTPEDVRAPMAEVLTKLPTMVDLGNEASRAATNGDFTKAADDFDELHEVWEGVEGTVKSTDADAYEKIETAQGLIKDGAETENASRVATGAADQGTAVRQFVNANK